MKQSRVGGVILRKMILITCLATLLAATAPQKPQPNGQGNEPTTTSSSNRRATNSSKKKTEPKAAAEKAVVPADPEPLVKMSLDAGIEAANAALKAAQEEIARLQAIGSDGKSEPSAALKLGAEAAVAGAAAVQKQVSKERKKPSPEGEGKEQPEKPTSEKKPEPRKPEQKKEVPAAEKKSES